MSTVAEVITALEAIAPSSGAAEWDRVGLQLGDPAASAGTVGICHEVTDAIVEAAIDAGVGMLVTYHPLLFSPVTSLVAGSSPAGRAHRLVSAGIALGVVHTAFDVAPGGAADALAAELGLGDVRSFGPIWGAGRAKIVTFVPESFADDVADAMTDHGAGTIGAYTACSFRVRGTGTFIPGDLASPVAGDPGVFNREPETRIEMVADAGAVDRVVAALVHAHPYEEPAYDVYERRGEAGMIGRVGRFEGSVADLGRLVADRLGGVVRIAGSGTAERVAVIPGSGSSFLSAVAGIADVLVTGDVGHHRARDAVSRGIAVVDPGHAESERPGMRALYASVSEIMPTIDLTDIDPSPWREA